MIKKIAFIGAGSMAEAMIAGVIKGDLLKGDYIFVTNRSNQKRLDQLHNQYHVQATHDKELILKDADIVILSMKPNDVRSAIDSIKKYINPGQLIISVIAGLSTDGLLTLLGKEVPIVRAMPNTSASIGLSATALAMGENTSDNHLKMADALFKTIGTTVMIHEKDMHIVTGISGSGPAYVYYLVEAMEQAAIEAGLDKEIAQSLITQTVRGAGEMLKRSGKSARTLREEITSPSGTTEAGLKALDTHGFKKAVMTCVNSACKRSKELSSANKN